MDPCVGEGTEADGDVPGASDAFAGRVEQRGSPGADAWRAGSGVVRRLAAGRRLLLVTRGTAQVASSGGGWTRRFRRATRGNGRASSHVDTWRANGIWALWAWADWACCLHLGLSFGLNLGLSFLSSKLPFFFFLFLHIFECKNTTLTFTKLNKLN